MRLLRKVLLKEFTLTGMDYDTDLDVFRFIDSSSTNDEMLTDLLSEVKGCMEQYTNFIQDFAFLIQILILFMSLIQHFQDIHDIEIEGGGGTEFDCMFDLICKKKTLSRS